MRVEDNTREEFLRSDQYEKLAEACMKEVLRCSYIIDKAKQLDASAKFVAEQRSRSTIFPCSNLGNKLG
jgi:hypothetical protein